MFCVLKEKCFAVFFKKPLVYTELANVPAKIISLLRL